ncbi:cation diffusion facilitator family transporter [Martelella mediterranea]|uniref:Protein p34 n=1 Tax=Martelella mediterranea TaxID=293089 RepID=A0A4R3NWZ0_9HYPH|nr:cation diffusion facilitator family transporter [Martelella mediterranea]TCT44884.1 cation diffusion facilitator family transporter [Martelella mediterranea]
MSAGHSHGHAMPKKLAFYTIPLSLLVLAIKLFAWRVTGSVALLSDALESIVNVVASVGAFIAIVYAAKPADHDHQFGHHKAEYISAVIEGVAIVVAALLIFREAIVELFHPTMPKDIFIGLAVNVVASLINGVWAYTLIKAGRAARSPALVGDGQHIRTDVITSIGVVIGLGIALATGYPIFDPLLALLVAAHILYAGWQLIAESVGGLMDTALTGDEEEAIRKAIFDNADGSTGVHDLKTRRAGSAAFIDFHLVVRRDMPVGEAHDICDRLEGAIKKAIPGSTLAIHVEPEGVKPHGVRVRID